MDFKGWPAPGVPEVCSSEKPGMAGKEKTGCRKVTPEEKKAQVRDCLRRRRVRLKKLGLCVDCGNRMADKDRTLCVDCLEDRRRQSGAKRRIVQTAETIERMMTLSGA